MTNVHYRLQLSSTFCRFTDFIVYEVDEENNIIRLKDIAKPVDPEDQTIVPKPLAMALTEPVKWTTEISDVLAPIMSSQVLKDLEDLILQGPNDNPGNNETLSVPKAEGESNVSKDERAGELAAGEGKSSRFRCLLYYLTIS